jgi:hypothetical protein
MRQLTFTAFQTLLDLSQAVRPVWRQLILPVATIILAGLEPSSLVHHRAV